MPAKKTTILVVDDDVQLLKIVTHNLEAAGYHVLAVRDGVQALEAIEREAPDLVLLDVMLPRMDGFEVCQRVRAFSAVPIIMITARGRGQDKVKGLDLVLEHVWGPEYVGEGHMLRVNITRLRRKLETDPSHPRYLLTRPGIGYFLVEDPDAQEAP